MISLTPVRLKSVAVIGVHCDDIAIGVGATLMEIVRDNPDVVVHALVLSGGGTEREVEEKNAFAMMCPSTDVRLTVADLPHGRLPDHWGTVKQHIAGFRRECQPDMVFGPQRHDYHHDHRLVAELIPETTSVEAGKPFEVAQNHRTPKNIWNLLQRSLHRSLNFMRGELIEGSLSEVFNFDHSVALFRLRIDRHVLLQVPLEPTPVIQRLANRNAVQPGLQRTPAPKRANPFERL